MQVSPQGMKWLRPALDVIKRVEPATYARMQECYWPVYVTDSVDDIAWVTHDGYSWWSSIANGIPESFGITIIPDWNPDTPQDLAFVTFLNRPDTVARAGKMGVPVADFVADILVHEFTHRAELTGEPAAFAAGTRFARELGSQALVDLSEETLREEEFRS